MPAGVCSDGPITTKLQTKEIWIRTVLRAPVTNFMASKADTANPMKSLRRSYEKPRIF